LAALAVNISRDGGPSMRPAWWEFSHDPVAISADLDDQYLLGPDLLVAPVVTQVRTRTFTPCRVASALRLRGWYVVGRCAERSACRHSPECILFWPE
jgi:hypothetical protein